MVALHACLQEGGADTALHELRECLREHASVNVRPFLALSRAWLYYRASAVGLSLYYLARYYLICLKKACASKKLQMDF